MTYRTDELFAARFSGPAPLTGFLLVVCLSVLLYLLYGAESDSTTEIYTAGRSLRPAANALALTGDYVSVTTLLTVTGSVSLAGGDGIALAAAGVGTLVVLLVLARPLRDAGGVTLGDTWGALFPGGAVRVAGTVATLCFCLPLTIVQLEVAGAAVAYLMGLSDLGPAAQLCTAFIGVIMICAASLSGMRGNSILQAIKTVVLLLGMTVLAGQVMSEFGWSPHRLLAAAADGSARPGRFYTGVLLGGDGTAGGASRLSELVTVALGAGVAPHLLMRLRASDRGASARRTVRHTIVLVTVFSGLGVVLGLGAAGLVGGTAVRAADPQGLAAMPMLALQLADGKSGGGAILALTVSMIFLTSLTVVASLTLSSAASVAHDIYALRAARGTTTSEIRVVRWSGAVLGALAVVPAVVLEGQNVTFLAEFSVATAASAILPSMVLGLFWPRFTRRGMLCSVYGGIVCCVVLQLFGPGVSGSTGSILPGSDFAWFPLETTGLVSVPVGFLLAWAVSRTRQRPGSEHRATRKPVSTTRY
ncbi:cation acetate symporter [Streptomyces sp. NPDC090306]|uniref:sodium:solute symporter family transporter n=1 Tax=Streptomyces sp. NPDC090306 TaxID=3365961 RepID=UPI00381588FC